MIYQISSGQGPSECEKAVALFLDYLEENYDISVVDTSAGYHQGDYRSVRFYAEEDLSAYVGSVQWICRSPYRPHHERKNWFIDFQPVPVADTKDFDSGQVVYATLHSGGKGGQNVNKVETGVRAIYVPTGEMIVCTEERSQYANRQKALARLKENFDRAQKADIAEAKNGAWRKHTQIVRGNAVTKFKGMGFIPCNEQNC